MQLGHKRSLSRKTPFDAAMLVILAAVLSRAINGSAAFFATLGGGWFWCCSIVFARFWHFIRIGFGMLVKGRPDVIVARRKTRLARCGATMFQSMIWPKTCFLAHTRTTFPYSIARVERSGELAHQKIS